MEFKKATRVKTKARILLAGQAGSGKTFTALKIAEGLLAGNDGSAPENKLFVLNTEIAGDCVGASELYADEVPHIAGIIEYPYEPDEFVKGIDECIKAGAEVIIIDSATHEWEGVLTMVTEMERNVKNKVSVWSKATPAHDRFIQAVISCPVHIIVTVRTEDKVGIDDNGKPFKIIDKYIARKGEAFGYEFSVVLHTNMAESATVAKSRYMEIPVNKVYDLKDTDMYEEIRWAHNVGEEPPVTKGSFIAMLRRFGYATSEDMANLKKEVPELDQPWTAESHQAMMNALMEYHKNR